MLKPELKAKTDELFSQYIDCASKAMKDYLSGKQINFQELQVLGDSIRVLHHICKMNNEEIL